MLELFKKKIYEPNSSCVIKCVNKINKIIEALEGEGGKKKMYITNVYFLIDIISLFLFQPRYWNAFCNINMFRLFMTSICIS